MNSAELIIDSFAGGGGASLGIEMALGRSPDVAINHDAEAIALHAANHATTKHYREDVWKVDPLEATGGKPVGLMWLSPDCKHFSKAKGGKPVSKRVRGLAWVAVRWAAAVKPRVIVLENVEEFQTWGPVLRDTQKPCPDRKGKHFRAFISKLRKLGYVVDWKELRACDYGAPTIRKRLFLVARCDGQPIVWPKATHGKHRALPWRTAAECIDWSIPCPSIFTRKKALAENTLKRIAAGVRRYVIETGKPFIVNTANGKTTGRGPNVWAGEEPLRTVTASPGFGVVAPFLTEHAQSSNQRNFAADEPLRTQCAGVKGGHFAAVTPFLVPRYGERDGQEPRAIAVDTPMPTVVPTQNGASLVAPMIAPLTHHGAQRGQSVTDPLATVTGAHRGEQALVTAFLAKHYGGVVGSQLEAPIGTVTGVDHHSLVAAHVTKLRGDNIGHPADEPLHTLSAGGTHFAEVRAFLVAYYGNEKEGGSLFDAMRTVTSKERFGIVTVDGHEYQIADIGMRMLAPRELYRAQGFPDTYRIDVEFNGKPMTKTAQVRMCGNSVCPPVAAAIVAANVPEMAVSVAAGKAA